MTDAEKIAAFDALAASMTNRFADGLWSWWCPTPCGGETKYASQPEAVADLVRWAERMAKWAAKRTAAKTPEPQP